MKKEIYDSTNFLGSIKVLIADDDKLTLKLLSDTLRIFGVKRVMCACNGMATQKEVYETKYDLIILDWKIGHFDGCNLVKEIRHNEKAKNRFTPIILLTGKGTADEVRLARDNGITEFLLKPFTVKKLRAKLIEVVEHPRNFIISRNFVGPDRRRVKVPVKNDRRKKDK
jgi:two-component system chemotaxis response regulator CheY